MEVVASSRDIRASFAVEIEGDTVRVPLTAESSIGEVMAHPIAGPIIMQALSASAAGGIMADPTIVKMMASAPIGRMLGFPGTGVEPGQLEQLLAAANVQPA